MASKQKKRTSKASKRAAKRAAAARAKAQKTQRPGAGGGYEYKPPKGKPIVPQAEVDRRIRTSQNLAKGSDWLRSSRMATPGPTRTYDLFRDPTGLRRMIGDRGMPTPGYPEGRNVPDEGVSGARNVGARAEAEARQKARVEKTRERARKEAAGRRATQKPQVLGPDHGPRKPPLHGPVKPPLHGPHRLPTDLPSTKRQGAHLPSKSDVGFLGPLKETPKPKPKSERKPETKPKTPKPKPKIPKPKAKEGFIKKAPIKKSPKVGGAIGTAVSIAAPYVLGKHLEHRDKMKRIKKRRAEEEEKSVQGRPTKFKKARTIPTPKAKPRKKKRSRRSTEPAAWNYEAGVSDDL